MPGFTTQIRCNLKSICSLRFYGCKAAATLTRPLLLPAAWAWLFISILDQKSPQLWYSAIFTTHTLGCHATSRMFSIINLRQLKVPSQVGYLETVTSFVPVNNSIYCQKLGFKFLCTQNQLLTSQDKLAVCKKLKFKWRHQVIMAAIKVQCVSYILRWSWNVNL